jgi:hypothetical protein
MQKVTYTAAAIGFLALTFPAFAVYQEPKIPQTDQGEQIPNHSIKLDQGGDKPSTEKKKPQKEVKPREPDRTPRQATRKPGEGQPEQGMSPDTQRAVGTMLDIGIGVGMGMGRRGADRRMDDGGMRDR